MYYETEIPSLTRISLHVVLTNLVNTNFGSHDFFQEPKVALTKELVYEKRSILGGVLKKDNFYLFQNQHTHFFENKSEIIVQCHELILVRKSSMELNMKNKIRFNLS